MSKSKVYAIIMIAVAGVLAVASFVLAATIYNIQSSTGFGIASWCIDAFLITAAVLTLISFKLLYVEYKNKNKNK